MRYYLVDTENVSGEWLSIINEIKTTDKIILFYTENSLGATKKDIQRIELAKNKKYKIEMVECYIGHNALDFQLISYMGHILNKRAKAEFVIVSKDHGYDPACKFWKKMGYNVKREGLASYSEERIFSSVVKHLKPKEAEIFRDILHKSRSKKEKEVKSYLHGALTKSFGQEEGLLIYKSIRKNILKYNKKSA